jgi:hypothetical protein
MAARHTRTVERYPRVVERLPANMVGGREGRGGFQTRPYFDPLPLRGGCPGGRQSGAGRGAKRRIWRLCLINLFRVWPPCPINPSPGLRPPSPHGGRERICGRVAPGGMLRAATGPPLRQVA